MVKELGFAAAVGIAVIGVALGAAVLGNAMKPAPREFPFSIGGNNTSPGQAPMATSLNSKEWDWSGGDKITINVPGSVRTEEGSPARIIVHGDAGAIARITFVNGKLSASSLIQTDMFRSYSPALNRVEVILRGVHLNTFDVYGNDKINLGHIDQDQLNIRISGNSDVEAEGRAGALAVQVFGSGKIYLGKLAANTAAIDISGTGNVEVAPSEKLNATIRGSGKIRLFSRPQDVQTDISGRGQIIQAVGEAPSQMDVAIYLWDLQSHLNLRNRPLRRLHRRKAGTAINVGGWTACAVAMRFASWINGNESARTACMDFLKDVPIPFNLLKNDRDRRGFPIPYVVYRDTAGVPHFTVDDVDKLQTALSKKLCGLCGKPLKLGQMWLIGGVNSMFLDDGMFTVPPGHEECARYSIQICPFLAARSYSKLIEDKTLNQNTVHDTAELHNDQITPPRPLFFVLARTSGIKLIDPEDGSGKKYILPRRPWKEMEFWQNGKRITQAEAELIAESSAFPPSQLKWWPA